MQGYRVFGKEDSLEVYECIRVQEIAKKYAKSPRQIALKYLMQSGFSVITSPMERRWMEDNILLFDFELTDDEMDYQATFDMVGHNTAPSQDYKLNSAMLNMF